MIKSFYSLPVGAQWLSGRVLDSRPRGPGFEPHQRHCVVSLGKTLNTLFSTSFNPGNVQT